nr:RNA-guided endonuclease TnpB family protein [Oscillatoria sp. PCC 10802]
MQYRHDRTEEAALVKYVKPKEAAKALGVHERTLCRWEKEGRIEAIKTPSRQRRYNIESYTSKSIGRYRGAKTVIYARVSRRDRQPDLNRQVAFVSAEPIPSACEQGTQFIFSGKRWFAIFPEPAQMSPTKAEGGIALDPGVRTFLTSFDGRKFLEFVNGDIGRITRLCQHLDNFVGRIAKESKKRRRRSMRRAAQRMRGKIRDLIDEAHKQIAHYLIRNYRLIFLPAFETSGMVARAKQKIRSKTAKAMLTWAHYRVKMTLKHQAELTGTTVVDVTEEYASKTCTRCGHVHSHLGGSTIFHCPTCGFTLPRDWNGDAWDLPESFAG